MPITDKDYATRQELREEAGRQHKVVKGVITGTIDGVNRSFFAEKLPVVDNNYDDAIDTADVLVYDDGVVVPLTSVNGTTGEIVLNSAPASGSVLRASYEFSELKDAVVDKRRKSAIGFVKRELKGIVDYSAWASADDIPDELRTIVLMYASGLILIRDHGSSADTDETSKDGYKRLSWAKSAMKEYVQGIQNDSDSANPVTAVVKTDGNIFPRNKELTETSSRSSSPPDDDFMRDPEEM